MSTPFKSSKFTLLFALLFVSVSANATSWQGQDWQLDLHGFLTIGASSAVGNNDGFILNGTDVKLLRNDHLDFAYPSVLGGRMDLSYQDFGVSVQAVSVGRKDWDVDLEWAYLSYRPNDRFHLRAGRVINPYLMLSQTRHIGLAYPWPVPLFDLYSMPAMMNGIEAFYHFSLGKWYATLSPHYLEDYSGDYFYGKKQYGLTFTMHKGDHTELWAILHQNPFPSLYESIGEQQIAATAFMIGQYGLGMDVAQATAFSQQAVLEASLDPFFQRTGDFTRLGIGFRHEFDNWYTMGHLHRAKLTNDGAQWVWYLLAGYQVTPRVMPYVEYGISRSDSGSNLYQSAFPGGATQILEPFINALLEDAGIYKFHIPAVGIRYAVKPGMDLKMEWRSFRSSRNNNMFNPVGFNHRKIDVVTVALNFVF